MSYSSPSDRGKDKLEEEFIETPRSYIDTNAFPSEYDPLKIYQDILIPLLTNPSAFNRALLEEIPAHYREEVLEALMERKYLKEGSCSTSAADTEAKPQVIYILVTGTPRAGTSALGKYLASSSEVANLGEFPGFYIAHKVGPGIQKKVKAEYKPRFYSEMLNFSISFSAFLAKEKGCNICVDSNPFNLRIIKQLQKKLNPAIFIIKLRDYRGVISSLKRSYEAGYTWAGKNDKERAELYYKFYKRLKDTDPSRVIYLNYDQLCRNPDETLNEFDKEFYKHLRTSCGIQNPEEILKFNRKVFSQNQAPTYSLSVEIKGSSQNRTFNMIEKDGCISLQPIASFDPKEWPLQREKEVYGPLSKLLEKIISNNLHQINHSNLAFIEFFNTLKELKRKCENNRFLKDIPQNTNPCIWNVPFRNKLFIGRETFINDLYERLNYHTLDTSYLAIIGMAGSGKTQIAKEYANLYKTDYHLIWWFTGTNNLPKQYEFLAQSINDHLELCNQCLSSGLHLEKITNNFTTKVKDWLRLTPYPWLLIFDDIPSESSIKDYLPEKHNLNSVGHIIVTSKNSIAWSASLQLGIFKRDESVTLLEKITRLNDEDNADALADLLGDFPLAIAQAGAYIRARPSSSFQEYINLYNTKREELAREEEELLQQEVPYAYDKYKATISVTLNLALAEIQKHSSAAYEILILCAFISKRDILEEILKDWLTYRKIDSSFTLGKTIGQLMQHSIIEKENNKNVGNTYALHELVQRVTQDRVFLARSGFLQNFRRFLAAMADSPVKFGEYEFKTVQQELIKEFCAFFDSKSKELLNTDFSIILNYRKSLIYISHFASLIEHATCWHVADYSLDKIKWMGQILALIGLEFKTATSFNPKLDDDYVYILALTSTIFDTQDKTGSNSPVEALNHILQSAEDSYSSIQNSIGTMLFFGRGVNKDYQAAKKWYYQAAIQGNSLAQLNLGMVYDNIEQDDLEARKWYQRAAEQGNANAQYNLGSMCDEGKGGNQDYAEARKWYQRAAEQGFLAAQFNLGLMHYLGQGGPKDYAEARKWYQKAAEQGDAKAQFTLGMMYYTAEGGKQDNEKARYWFCKAADQGNIDALYRLSLMYDEDVEISNKQDSEKIRGWLEEVAEQGDVDAQYNLGRMYEEGVGAPQDRIKAKNWYQKAAEQGDVDALYHLNLMYDEDVAWTCPILADTFFQ